MSYTDVRIPTHELLKSFNYTTKKFYISLEEIFPELKRRQGFIDARDLSTSNRSLVVHFCKAAHINFELLITRDENAFAAEELLPFINFKWIFKRKISDSTRDTIWSYIHILMLLGWNYQLDWDKIQSRTLLYSQTNNSNISNPEREKMGAWLMYIRDVKDQFERLVDKLK